MELAIAEDNVSKKSIIIKLALKTRLIFILKNSLHYIYNKKSSLPPLQRRISSQVSVCQGQTDAIHIVM